MRLNLAMRRIESADEQPLARLFAALAEANERTFFWPHPLTAEQASRVACNTGSDFYGLGLWNGEAVVYGFLRGWDEGYEIPSLGISVHPEYRRHGLGRAFMSYLHSVASLRQCPRVRLRVHRENARARRLYEELGYAFTDDGQPQLTGFLELTRPLALPVGREQTY